MRRCLVDVAGLCLLIGAAAPAAGAKGSLDIANNFERITGAGFPEGAAVATDDSVIQGYGIEGITGEQARKDVAGQTMQYLLR